MSEITLITPGGVIILLILGVMSLSVRARNHRRQQIRLSVAFERAQAVRTRGSGLQGNPYGVYAEPAWSTENDRHRQ